ncbi:DNA polymerase III subunit delta [Patescibacteria group bacterium]|nr:DNA polymerase III subunit delta [Patescibacteria group bacterium]
MIFKLYHGSSPYLSLKALKQETLKFPDIQFQVVNAESQDSQTIFDKLGSQNLFVSKRGIIIKRLYKNKDKDKLIESILAILKQGTSTDIVFFWEAEKVRVNTRYLKFFKENSALEQYDEMNKRSFGGWLKEELETNGLNLDPTIQRLLAERTNYDPERCANEIQKLKLDPENDTTYIVDTLEKDIWALIDAINMKDKARSMEILENLYKQNNDPNYILSMLARNLRILTLVKHLNDQNKSFREICSILRIPPFTLPSILDTSKNYENRQLIQIYRKLSNLDLQIKTGKIDGHLGLTLICPYL